MALEVTRARVETSPPVASNQLGIRNSGLEVFSTEKPFREVSWIVFLGFQGLEGQRE